MDYSKLSDSEIDKLVLDKISNKKPEEWLEPYALFEPCSNPADAWPIIADNHIGIAPYPNEAYAWSSRHGMASDLSAEDKNPLRAAMTVFLMMQDSANVPANSTRSDL